MPGEIEPKTNREMLLRLATTITLLIGILVTVTIFIILRGTSEGKSSSSWTITLMGTLLTFAIGIYSTMAFFLLFRHPTSINISILGFPSVGKTVYLTVLFDELQRSQERGVRFAPYGTETVEQVTRDLNLLYKGRWLPPTKLGEVFPYRATASVNISIFKRRYKIEIGDFAGQNIRELDSRDEMWLHKTDYFKYVVQSDAVLLAIDCGAVIDGDSGNIEEMQNVFIAALNILIESKGVSEIRRLQAPVALLFLKADLLNKNGIQEKYLSGKVEKLISVCKQRCKHFNYFFVSSVGMVWDDKRPPEKLTPYNVVKPIIWILQNI